MCSQVRTVADMDYRQSQLDSSAASPPRNVLRDGYLLDISIFLYKPRDYLLAMAMLKCYP